MRDSIDSIVSWRRILSTPSLLRNKRRTEDWRPSGILSKHRNLQSNNIIKAGQPLRPILWSRAGERHDTFFASVKILTLSVQAKNAISETVDHSATSGKSLVKASLGDGPELDTPSPPPRHGRQTNGGCRLTQHAEGVKKYIATRELIRGVTGCERAERNWSPSGEECPVSEKVSKHPEIYQQKNFYQR